MKILQVNCVFQKGSTGKIVNDIHVSLTQEKYNSIVCYGRGKLINEPNIYKFCSEAEARIQALWNKAGGLLYGGSLLATNRLIRKIESERPDIVHLHCINGFCGNIYKLLAYLGQNNIKTVVTHHAEFFYTGSCAHAYDCEKWTEENGCHECPIRYEATKTIFRDQTQKAWQKMRKAFSNFKKENIVFTAVSPWVRQRSLHSPIVRDYPCEIVGNGVDTTLFKPALTIERSELLKRIPNLKQHIIIHVTPYFSSKENNKGGSYIVELARLIPDSTVIVVATHTEEVGKELPENMYVWGKAATQHELSVLYSIADLTIIASKRETFSMVCVESLSCGTPVVGFNAGGPESISISEYSTFVEYGNIELLKNAVNNMKKRSFDETVISEEAHSLFSKELMTSRYIQIYQQLMRQ